MIAAVLVLLGVVALVWAIARLHLRGEDLAAFDQPPGQRFTSGAAASDGHAAVAAALGAIARALRNVPRREQLAVMRKTMDELFPVREPAVRFVPADAGGVPAEWVLAPDADGSRRTLYLHGGAYTMGSPRSHRRLTSSFATMTGGAVLAIDYRLMPEYSRSAGIEDCRTAYRWLLDHGPNGPGALSKLWVAGDSAGANLALSLIAWARDAGLRPADGVVAMSPATDATLGSPSLRANLASDPMLGPLFARLARWPRTLLLWYVWWQARINPRDPAISPVYGDLSRLPPVLVQTSEAEMLRDDARRYANRAKAAGSPVTLQTWERMVHVWQLFDPELAEARAALAEVRRFLAKT